MANRRTFHPDRRAFLRGAGSLAIGLPLLQYTHGDAWAQSAVVRKRFIVFFEHGGTISTAGRGHWRDSGTGNHHGWDDWWPSDPGEALKFGPIHQPLLPWQSKCIVPRGIDNMACTKQAPYKGSHGWANVTALTASQVTTGSDGKPKAGGPSIDHVIAQRLAKKWPVPFSSIHLYVPAHNYGTPFMSGASAPVSSESDPVKAFNTLFAGVTGSGPDPAVVAMRERKLSVLDGVVSGFSRLRARVGAEDRATLDQHLEFIRELETRVDALSDVAACTPPNVSSSTSAQVKGPMMADIIVAALRCGLTNVATLNVGDLITSWLNGPLASKYDLGHSMHHDGRDVGPTGPDNAIAEKWRQEMQLNRQWRMGLVARILDGLDKIPEGNGTMLDNSVVLCTSEFSDGSVHSSSDLPILLAGSGGGYFKTGRHLVYETPDPDNSYATRSSTHNLFTSILHAFDQTDAHFGSTHATFTGPLPGLN